MRRSAFFHESQQEMSAEKSKKSACTRFPKHE